ncbi:MAG: DUF6786 family protein, partial [Candidatus Korarchaeota archaeon]
MLNMCEIGDRDIKAIVLEYGARLLSLELGGINVLWQHPEYAMIIEKREWNTGGERTWISPERSFFYTNPATFEGWHCQSGLDPDSYVLEKSSSKSAFLRGKINVKNYESGEVITGEITREIKLRDTRVTGDYVYTHFGIISELRAYGASNNFALWDILQVPVGDAGYGFAIIPTKPDAKPIHYFDPVPEEYLTVYHDHVRLKLDGNREFKIGIVPEDMKDQKLAQIAYLYKNQDKYIAILMTSPTAPLTQDECMDPAKSNPNGPKGAVQSYNSDVNKSGLRFGEIEIQGARATMHPDKFARAQHIINLRA